MSEDLERRKPAIGVRSFAQLVVVAVLALVIVIQCVRSPDKDRGGMTRSPGTPGEPLAAAAPLTAEEATAVHAEQDARAAAVVQANRFKEYHTKVKSEVAALERSMTAWEARKKELLQGDQGKRIAANKTALLQARELLDAPRADRETIERLRSDADTLLSTVEEGLAEAKNISSPEKSLAQITEILSEAQKANKDYVASLKALNALVARTAGEAPGTKTLDQAKDEIDAEQAQAHAAAMKKIADDATTARQQREIEEAKDRNHKAAIARDPKALKLLDFTGLDRPDDSGCWMACFAADAYESPATFFNYAYSPLKTQIGRAGFGRDWEMDNAIREEFKQRDQLAQTQFGMSLHELYKVAVLSEANQKRFATDQRMRKLIEEAQAKGNKKDASDWAEILAKGKRLPAPLYP